MPRNKDLSAYTALVTGASSGIGLEYARQLAARGANLVMVSIDREDLDREAKKIVDTSGVSVETICMDLAQPDAANKLYDHCRQKGIQIEILINNAGIFSFQEITRTDPKKIETMLACPASLPQTCATGNTDTYSTCPLYPVGRPIPA